MERAKNAYDCRIQDLFSGEGFELAVSIDCEGTNFDRDMDANMDYLEAFLGRATDAGVATLLFVTPLYAAKLAERGLAERLPREYRVIYGLHIHPENLAPELAAKLPFLQPDEEFLAGYGYEEQARIIRLCYAYLRERGVIPLQIYRGGCFSMNDDTAKALIEHTDIRWESHNPYREHYSARSPAFKSVPVYALSRDEELRLEFFTLDRLKAMLEGGVAAKAKTLAITHSYMLNPKDFHYARDGIAESVHERLQALIELRDCLVAG